MSNNPCSLQKHRKSFKVWINRANSQTLSSLVIKEVRQCIISILSYTPASELTVDHLKVKLFQEFGTCLKTYVYDLYSGQRIMSGTGSGYFCEVRKKLYNLESQISQLQDSATRC